MHNTILKIDFIDDSADMAASGTRDYIGSARIPLKDLMSLGRIPDDVPVTIRDEHSGVTGKVFVSITIQDA